MILFYLRTNYLDDLIRDKMKWDQIQWNEVEEFSLSECFFRVKKTKTGIINEWCISIIIKRKSLIFCFVVIRCACRDWAAYERKEDRWINHYNVTWFCNPDWDIKRTDFVGIYMVDCDRQDHMAGVCEQDCSNATMWPPSKDNDLENTFIKPKCQPKIF